LAKANFEEEKWKLFRLAAAQEIAEAEARLAQAKAMVFVAEERALTAERLMGESRWDAAAAKEAAAAAERRAHAAEAKQAAAEDTAKQVVAAAEARAHAAETKQAAAEERAKNAMARAEAAEAKQAAAEERAKNAMARAEAAEAKQAAAEERASKHAVMMYPADGDHRAEPLDNEWCAGWLDKHLADLLACVDTEGEANQEAHKKALEELNKHAEEEFEAEGEAEVNEEADNKVEAKEAANEEAHKKAFLEELNKDAEEIETEGGEAEVNEDSGADNLKVEAKGAANEKAKGAAKGKPEEMPMAIYKPKDDRPAGRLRTCPVNEDSAFANINLDVGTLLKVLPPYEVGPLDFVRVEVPGKDGEFWVHATYLLWYDHQPGWVWQPVTDAAWYTTPTRIRLADCEIYVAHSGPQTSAELEGENLVEEVLGEILKANPEGIQDESGAVLLSLDSYTYVALWLYGRHHITLGYLPVLSDRDRQELADILCAIFKGYFKCKAKERPVQLLRHRQVECPTDAECIDYAFQLTDLWGYDQRQLSKALEEDTVRLHRHNPKKECTTQAAIKDINRLSTTSRLRYSIERHRQQSFYLNSSFAGKYWRQFFLQYWHLCFFCLLVCMSWQ
jgi:hypothetical protein